MAAAPVLAASILAGDSDKSFIALLFGFALAECWRAPAAILIRDVSPPGLGSAGAAVHLCVRNLIGGMGPLGEHSPLHTLVGGRLHSQPSTLPVHCSPSMTQAASAHCQAFCRVL